MKVIVRSVAEENLKLVVVLEDIHPALREVFRGTTLESCSSFSVADVIQTAIKEHYDPEYVTFTVSSDRIFFAFDVEDATDVGAASTCVAAVYNGVRKCVEELHTKLQNYPELFIEYLRAKLSVDFDSEMHVGQDT